MPRQPLPPVDSDGRFPGLRGTVFKETSKPTTNYNCIAWAASESWRWWWPDPLRQYHWPKEAPRQRTLEAFVEAFKILGYTQCDTETLEAGFLKVAIFINDKNEPTHAARQLPSGAWTSKLGPNEDIEHELHAVSGRQYGAVAVIMKRPI